MAKITMFYGEIGQYQKHTSSFSSQDRRTGFGGKNSGLPVVCPSSVYLTMNNHQTNSLIHSTINTFCFKYSGILEFIQMSISKF